MDVEGQSLDGNAPVGHEERLFGRGIQRMRSNWATVSIWDYDCVRASRFASRAGPMSIGGVGKADGVKVKLFGASSAGGLDPPPFLVLATECIARP